MGMLRVGDHFLSIPLLYQAALVQDHDDDITGCVGHIGDERIGERSRCLPYPRFFHNTIHFPKADAYSFERTPLYFLSVGLAPDAGDASPYNDKR